MQPVFTCMQTQLTCRGHKYISPQIVYYFKRISLLLKTRRRENFDPPARQQHWAATQVVRYLVYRVST